MGLLRTQMFFIHKVFSEIIYLVHFRVGIENYSFDEVIHF